MLIDPSSSEGARLVQVIRGASPGVPLEIEGQEVVRIDRRPQVSTK